MDLGTALRSALGHALDQGNTLLGAPAGDFLDTPYSEPLGLEFGDGLAATTLSSAMGDAVARNGAQLWA